MLLKDVLPILLNFSINLLFISLFFCVLILSFTHIYSADDFLRVTLVSVFLKNITYFSLFFICIIQFFLWFFFFEINSQRIGLIIYSDTIYSDISENYFNFFTNVNIKLNFFFLNYTINYDLFGLVVQFVGLFVGYLSYIVLDTRFFFKNIKYLTIFTIFSVIVILFTTTNNIIMFFLYYELLLLPSFLLVFHVSQARRASQASLYFVIWTQTGSFLVLCATAYLIFLTNCYTFSTLHFFKFSQVEIYILYILYFFGFGFKVPIWPLHFWLTKTHVEAPAGFSMYLSGFLVKTALYGFFKYTTILGLGVNTTIFIVITSVGVVDASIKMFSQVDFKKLVAFCTIQEMNLIYLMLCWGDSTGVITVILFTITHGFLSALMFYVVDCIQRRYNSRSSLEITGIIHTTPNLGILIFLMCILYSGIPGTMKFVCEFYLFGQLLSISTIFTFLLLFFANFIGVVGFCKCWFNSLFGMSTKYAQICLIDLNNKDIYIVLTCLLFIFGIPFLSVFFF